jgi:hypothetical protein
MYPKTIFEMSQKVSENHLQNVKNSIPKNHLQNVSRCILKQFSKLYQKYPKTIFKMSLYVSPSHLQKDIKCSPKTNFKMAPDVSQSHLQNTENSTTSTPKPSSKCHQMCSKTILKNGKMSLFGWSCTVLLKPCLLFSSWPTVYGIVCCCTIFLKTQL